MPKQWMQGMALLAGMFLTGQQSLADGIDIPNGTLTGNIETNGNVVRVIDMRMVGGGYTASKTFSDAPTYEMRAPGGDWTYDVTAGIRLEHSDNDGRITRVTPSLRKIVVPEEETVYNSYSITGNIRVHVAVQGDEYNSWNWYRYVSASQAVSGDGEQTASSLWGGGLANSPVVAVVPNDDIRVSSQVEVKGSYPGYDEQYTKLYSVKQEGVVVGEGQTVDVYFTVDHEIPPTPCYVSDTCENPEPTPCEESDTCPGTGYVHAKGHVELANMDDFRSWRVYAPGMGWSSMDNSQPWFDKFWDLSVHDRKSILAYVPVLRYQSQDMQGGSLFTPFRKRYFVEEDQVTEIEIPLLTGSVLNRVEMKGLIPEWQELVSIRSNSVTPSGPYYGGAWASNRVAGEVDTYLGYLTPGRWSVGDYLNAYGRSERGQIVNWSTREYGANRHILDVEAGSYQQVVTQMCFGDATVRVRDLAGRPIRLQRFTANGAKEGVRNASYNDRNYYSGDVVEVSMRAPEALYRVNTRILLEDGTQVTPPPLEVPVQCGVRTCSDPNAPRIVILDTPEANLVTNEASIPVTGTATDENGVVEVTVNGAQATVETTGAENQVAFSYVMPLQPGSNVISAIAVNSKDVSCFNERTVYVDRWMPEVVIEKPLDGMVYTPGESFDLVVAGEDRGYGYTLDVYLDGVLLTSREGVPEQGFATVEHYTKSLQFDSGEHEFLAIVTDRAGNRAEARAVVRDNRPPVADAGPDQAIEATGMSTQVMLDGTASYDPDGDPIGYQWTGAFGEVVGPTPTVSFPLGEHLVELLVTDDSGSDDADQVSITIADTTPPEADFKLPEGDNLWPPNHKMIKSLIVSNINDLVDADPKVAIVVSSNEADNGRGDGSTEEDWTVEKVGDSYEVWLRAERDGRGGGREYQVALTLTDNSGNVSREVFTFQVGHNTTDSPRD